MLNLAFVDSVPVRLFIHATSVVISMVVTHMVWKEYSRTQDITFRYLLAGFTIMFIQTLFMTGIFINTMHSGTPVPERFMPMVDHILKLVSNLLIVTAFISSSPRYNTYSRRFLLGNSTLLAIVVPVVWYFWLLVQVKAPGTKFGYFWGDYLLEVWVTGLIAGTIYLIGVSKFRYKKGFVLATGILLAKQMLHLVNLIMANNTIAIIAVMERSLSWVYFYALVMTIHNEIIAEINGVIEEKNAIIQELYQSTLRALASSLEVKDISTKGHSDRVTGLAVAVAKHLNLPEEKVSDIYYGAMLHDIGKIGVSSLILNKPGCLTPEERIEIEKHSIMGGEIIRGIEALKHIEPIVLHHHERYDGNGYPHGLKGEEIPLGAQIVAAADAYDAMTSMRPYRIARSVNDVVKELESCAGTQFDPDIIKALLQVVNAKRGHYFGLNNFEQVAASLS